jgi:hypothetical protein
MAHGPKLEKHISSPPARDTACDGTGGTLDTECFDYSGNPPLADLVTPPVPPSLEPLPSLSFSPLRMQPVAESDVASTDLDRALAAVVEIKNLYRVAHDLATSLDEAAEAMSLLTARFSSAR